MARWAAMIMDVNPKFLYRPGAHNAAADAISRIPFGPADGLEINVLDEDFVMMLYTPDQGRQAPEVPLTIHGASAAPSVGAVQKKDPQLAAIIAFLELNKLPTDEPLRTQVQDATHMYKRIQSEMGVDHPSIWKFIDGLRKVQKGRENFHESLIRGDQPPVKLRRYRLADERILTVVRDYQARTTEDYLRGTAHNYEMNP